MRSIILLLIIIFSPSIYGQTNFTWDKVDSISRNKNEIYSSTKMFISQTWNSAQDVIQNDDKDAGMILLKGLSSQSLYYQMNDHIWTFSYTVKFLMKDNKYRILIEDVYCKSARCQQYEWALMPVSDVYPSEKGLKLTGVSEQKYLEIMTKLKQDLQSIVDGYEKYLKTPKNTNADW
jgi:hypothetical protein